MKKILYYISAAILVLCMAACSKETPTTPETGRQMTIVANIEEALNTKANLDGNDTEGYQVLWSEGDKIEFQVKTESGKEIITYTLSEGAGTTSGVFTGPALPDGEYTAGYGDNLSMNNGGVLKTEQSYSPSMNAGCAPMMAEVTVADGVPSIAKFKNICGLMRLDLKGDNTIKAISVTTNEGLGGLIKIEEDGAARVSAYPAPKCVTLDCGENGVELTPEAKPFYISMPRNNYTGVKIEVTYFNNYTCTRTLKAGKTLDIVRAQITPVALEVTSFPKGSRGQATNKIGNTVGWVQLWTDGPKFAEYNVGVTDGKPESDGGHYKWGGHENHGQSFYEGPGDLSGDNDTAIYLWGTNWRMPTNEEFQALIDNCDKEWTTVNRVEGAKFTGKDSYASNSIFLPAVDDVNPGIWGYYWSSSRWSELFFDKSEVEIQPSPMTIFYGSVRAVLAE